MTTTSPTFINQISADLTPISLLETDPYRNNQPARIVLYLDMEDQIVYVNTKYNDGTTSFATHYGTILTITLPISIDPTYLYDDINDLLPSLNQLLAGYTSQYNSQMNLIGVLTDEAQELLYDIRYTIEINPYRYFHILEDRGIWTPDDYLQSNSDNDLSIDAYTTRDDLNQITNDILDEASSIGIYLDHDDLDRYLQNRLYDLTEE